MREHSRIPNFFEKFLLVIGVFIIIIGYGFIQTAVRTDISNYWLFLQSVFLWMILIVLVILLAVNENMKEELKLIAEEQLQEIRILSKKESKEVDVEEEELKILEKLGRLGRKKQKP